MLFVILVSAISFLITFLSVPILMRKFLQAGLTGRDVHKQGKPDIPEMGGLAVVAGFVAGVLAAVSLITFSHSHFALGFTILALGDTTGLFAALTTILIIAIIGIFDDLVKIRHSVKMLLPLAASLPLVAVAAGHPYITIPLIGHLYLPIIYPLILIPLAVTTVSNLTNMLAGFNGLESGLGAISCFSLGVVALSKGSVNAAVLLLPMSASLIAFARYNKYPARIFMGDVGALSIGACIASSVIIGNFEVAGIVVMIPYIMDFALKAKNRFPREIEYTKLQGGKLTTSRTVGLPSLILRLAGGISEARLVYYLLAFEAICSVAAIWFF